MSQATIVMGPAAVVTINGVNITVTDSEVHEEFKDHDTNDSADAVFDNSKGGRKKLVMSIKGHRMSDVVWTTGNGTFVTVAIYPCGLAFPAQAYSCPTFQLTRFSSTHPAKEGGPSMVSIDGHSTGSYTEP